MPPNLARVNAAARKAARTQFTALLHHVNVEALERAFRRQKRRASAGVDGITVTDYEQNLVSNLEELCQRIHTNRYRPQPVRRVHIPKADGGRRPLGVPTLEDKIVQGAVAEVLSSIYEVDFMGFSYGFRPGRNPHQALSALHTAIMSQYVNWVLDADIRNFYDSIDHEWLMRMVAHRIADPRILRLIRMWLEAGTLESGEWYETDKGTPQGAGISPCLANIVLHYALDLWVHQWRRRHASGRVSIVRYADDFVMGFERLADARRMMADLKERLARFGLALHEDKTRLIEFGRLPAMARRQRGARRLDTFAFLGLTHYSGWTRDGRFIVKRKTQSKRMTRKLKALRQEAWQIMHAPMATQHRWYSSVLRGHYGYYGVPHNWRALNGFLQEVRRIWFTCLRRRSQKNRDKGWDWFETVEARFPLPRARVVHSWA
ncbi:group II intron reverse transcriptase/maturase [Bradyrhizobium barranii subsp. apii]|uniref:Group II intron reverse transcriptase/maturase n=1 Tax=Bradyrhizobium barranii subsp. apii TaxID=2819348 RepID=A0A8T5VFX6_9BRAD|nr:MULTISPECIES: group II intron reverse transcriptase/maturase [Bradyrhizobium]MCK7664839.1 group II intron reverse transcriptase/maturase [Bradyrhizobium sp. 2S1]MCK7664942.1 group II intron reverse transcriptase/maturase [Bradyrhizobium sp. 2S1]MCK7673424.1 group II intron reverse transcriptase/maturase [Bradyrhizobium sp. 2S1]UGY20161.1 group II intron reverse transcriptase/maturase [Bradyrhizobium septentrionale]UPT88785.1 group II intron reverse transcriptase/maturase [Bradyrhizobium bar